MRQVCIQQTDRETETKLQSYIQTYMQTKKRPRLRTNIHIIHTDMSIRKTIIGQTDRDRQTRR